MSVGSPDAQLRDANANYEASQELDHREKELMEIEHKAGLAIQKRNERQSDQDHWHDYAVAVIGGIRANANHCEIRNVKEMRIEAGYDADAMLAMEKQRWSKP